MAPAKALFKDFVEFGSVPAAMFTAFRCFTDGCAATDGTPLQDLGPLRGISRSAMVPESLLQLHKPFRAQELEREASQLSIWFLAQRPRSNLFQPSLYTVPHQRTSLRSHGALRVGLSPLSFLAFGAAGEAAGGVGRVRWHLHDGLHPVARSALTL